MNRQWWSVRMSYIITSTLCWYLPPHLTAEVQQLNFHVWALSESDGHSQIYLWSKRFYILQSPLKKTTRNDECDTANISNSPKHSANLILKTKWIVELVLVMVGNAPDFMQPTLVAYQHFPIAKGKNSNQGAIIARKFRWQEPRSERQGCPATLELL